MSTEKCINAEKDNDVLPDVSRSFKHSMLDVWAFAEWRGLTYVRLNDCWVH